MIILLIVTMTSLLVAAVMSTIAWRISGEERRRSEARVAALAADIHLGMTATVPAPARIAAAAPFDLPLRAMPRSADLFVHRPARSALRTFAIMCGGFVVFALAVATAILLPAGYARQSIPAPTAAAARPLELVALEHERLGDQLTVRGVVRNPPSGAEIDRLTAIVVLFSPDGGFVESGRAAVDASALKAGGESAFAVTVPRAGDIGRYRVSFRTDDQVVSHVDRRHESS